MLMLTYKSYYNMAPPYLCELINKKESHVNTRLEVDLQIVQNIYRRQNEQLVEAKSTYFTNKVNERKDDPKARKNTST